MPDSPSACPSTRLSTADPPANAFQLADMLEEIVLDFRDVLAREMREIGRRLGETEADAGERVKAYTGFFKVLQGVEMMTNGIRQQRETQTGSEVEMVDFRRAA